MNKVRVLSVSMRNVPVADCSLRLNMRQLNNFAGGGQTGEQKEGESPKVPGCPGRVC